MKFKNLIGIYEKELARKILNGENYFSEEADSIKSYYSYFEENIDETIFHLKILSEINFKAKNIDFYNSEQLFIFICKKYIQ